MTLPAKDIKVIAGNATPELAENIAKRLNKALAPATVERFPDGEIRVKVEDDVRGADVFVIQSTCPPTDSNLMELLIMMDCLRRASAERITAVIPYYGYARQDRKDEGRVPITAKLVANMVVTAGANRVLTMDLHANQIQGFFDVPVDHLHGGKTFVDYYRRQGIKDLVVLAPDVGSSKRAGFFAKQLDTALAIVDKRRLSAEKTQVLNLIGSVEGKNVLIPDDMIATGGSIVEAAMAARKAGAKDIYICATHPVLAGPAVERLTELDVAEVAVLDTIPTQGKQFDKLKVLTCADILAEAIRRIHLAESISIMFEH